MKKIIAVFTGNRAEYGLQKPVLQALKNHPVMEYRLIVSGAHLDDNFGKTIDLIKSDNFEIHAKPRISLENDDLTSTSLAIGNGIIEMVKVLTEMKPDMLVVYADRFEGFAAVIAASQMRIPVAHIEGGDITEGGALDDSVRHAMTKLSHLHFATNEEAKNRILAMGEEDWRVFNVGLPAIDTITQGNFAGPDEIAARFNLDLSKPVMVFTQHSITNEFEKALEQLSPSLKALERLAKEGIQIIVTYPNNDAGGKKIIQELQKFNERKIPGIQIHPSLGTYFYYGVLSLATKGMKVLCAGNSSSGIKETPIFGCPTLNIGTRQLGRLKAENVLDVDYNEENIYQAARKALFDTEFIKTAHSAQNPYGDGHAGIKIVDVLAKIKLDQKLILKKMTI